MRSGTFFFPGPTEVRREVLETMLRQPMQHRTPEFERIYDTGQRGLQTVLRTERPVFVATASGSAMMEAAVRGAPPGRILAVVNGGFGARFAAIADACERPVDRVEFRWGEVPDPEAVRERLAAAEYSAMTFVHCETSTGVMSDVRALAAAAREAGVMSIVDSVSGAGGARLETDAWGVDCVVTASQKALALPPGLAFACASTAFLDAMPARDRGFYLDLAEYAAHARNSQTPTTPAVSLFYALALQAAAIEREGMDAREARHRAMLRLMEDWVWLTANELGIELAMLAPPDARTPTVSVVMLPSNIAGPALVRAVAERGYVIGAGYGPLRETAFRVGHMGDHTVAELSGCLDAVRDALLALRG